jgi:HK97 family phage prohead protease
VSKKPKGWVRSAGAVLRSARPNSTGEIFYRSTEHAPLRLLRDIGHREAQAQELTITGNKATGWASLMGTPYSIGWCGEVIFPGAFDGTLERFLTEGWVARTHDWDDEPIAMCTMIEERDRGLYVEHQYHSHQEAQDALTTAGERLAKKQFVGLSIGFYLTDKGYLWFENGKNLWDYAQNNGYDMARFDRAALMAWEDWIVGVVQVERLVEYSQVNIPACDGAGLIECDSLSPETQSAPPLVVVPPTTLSAPAHAELTRRVSNLRADSLLTFK